MLRSPHAAFALGVDTKGAIAAHKERFDAEALAFRRGPGSEDVPDSLNTLDDPVPELARWELRTGALKASGGRGRERRASSSGSESSSGSA